MSNLKDRTLTIERILNAPIKLVWQAWSDPAHIANWWGPKGMNTRVVLHEFKEGGKWQFNMTMPDGNEFITEGVYKEIVEHVKIISSADFKPMTEGVEIQSYFEAIGDKTKFTFSVVHETVEYCQAQEKMGFYNGWASTFDRMQEYLEIQ